MRRTIEAIVAMTMAAGLAGCPSRYPEESGSDGGNIPAVDAMHAPDAAPDAGVDCPMEKCSTADYPINEGQFVTDVLPSGLTAADTCMLLDHPSPGQVTNALHMPFGTLVTKENELGVLGTYLRFRDGDVIFTYIKTFTPPLELSIGASGELGGLLYKELDIFGEPAAIIDARMAGDSINLEMLHKPVSVELVEDGLGVYVDLECKEYAVKLQRVERDASGVLAATYLVDGASTKALHVGEQDVLGDGSWLHVYEITESSTGDSAKAYLSDKGVRFFMSPGDAPASGMVEVNEEDIEDAHVRYDGSVTPGNLTFAEISYQLLADNPLGDVYIPAGERLSQHLDEPEGLLGLDLEHTIVDGQHYFRLLER